MLTMMNRLRRAAHAWSLRLLAVLLLLLGLVLLPLPIPLGLPLLMLGLGLLVSASTSSAEVLRRVRRRYPRFDARLRAVELKMPRLLQIPLRKTDPDPARMEELHDAQQQPTPEPVEHPSPGADPSAERPAPPLPPDSPDRERRGRR